jgi:protein gp37
MMPTGISYVDETVSPVIGCSPASPGCANCFAQAVAHRGMCEQHRGLTDEHGRWTGEVRLEPKALEKPLRWRKPKRILWETMGDIFHDAVPDEYIAACFGVMAATAHHTHLVLTKRIERVPRWLSWADSR